MARQVAARLTAPHSENKWYLHTLQGGYNNSISVGSPSVLPNCVGWARGRFSEIADRWIDLPNSNAGLIFDMAKARGYQTGNTPMAGACVCWSKAGAPGHIAVVEKVNSDGSIIISQSGYKSVSFSSIVDNKGFYNSTAFYAPMTTKGPNWINWSGYVFQGFIYHPDVLSGAVEISGQGYKDKLTDFIEEAEKHVRENYEWTSKMSGLGPGQHWCAAFVVAVKRAVGGLDEIIATTYGSGDHARIMMGKGKGSWIPGPSQGGSSRPSKGDLIFFRWDSPSEYLGKDRYYSDHVGIVIDVGNGFVTTVEGNTGGGSPYHTKVSRKQYPLNNQCINGYYRPDWAEVGGSVTSGEYLAPLYSGQNLNDSNDASIREIGYLGTNLEPTINTTDIKLSVINYTNGLAAVFNNLVLPNYQVSGSSADYDVSNLSGNAKVIAQFIVDKGCTAAAAVGWLCNIEAESGFRPGAIGDNGTSGGICQWHAGRFANMKKYVGLDWKTNLTGQLNFWWQELNASYKGTLNVMRMEPDTLQGAKNICEYICINYEKPADRYNKARQRAANADKFWKQIVPQLK